MKQDEATKSIQFVLLLASAVGVVIAALNVYLFSKQAPLLERVSLIEQAQAYNAEINVEGFKQVTEKLSEIKGDVKDIKNYLNLR